MNKITIPGTLPDMNKIIKISKAHPMAYSTEKKTYTDAVAWIAKGLPEMQRVSVTCHWYCPDRRIDPDNISVGIKFILDGLVKAGVLKNDGWKQIAEISHKFYIDTNPRIEVELVEVEPCESNVN